MLILYKSCYIQQAWSVPCKRWNMICNVKKLFCRKQQNDLWIVWIIRNYRKIHRCFFWVLWLTATLILGKQISSGQGESKSLAFSAVCVYLNYVCLRIEQAYAFMWLPRVREKYSHPLVHRTSTILNLVV